MVASEDTLIVRDSRIRSLGFLAGCLLALVALSIVWIPDMEAPFLVHGVSAFGIPFVLGFTALCVKRCALPGRRILLEPSGITDLYAGFGPVPWSRVRTAFLAGRFFVGLEVDDPEAFFQSGKPIQHWLARRRTAWVDLPLLLLNTAGTQTTPEELLAAIQVRIRSAPAPH